MSSFTTQFFRCILMEIVLFRCEIKVHVTKLCSVLGYSLWSQIIAFKINCLWHLCLREYGMHCQPGTIADTINIKTSDQEQL